MSKMNKITFNMVAAEMAEDIMTEVSFSGKNNELKISVRRRLDFEDAMKFVRDVAASCTDVNEGLYMPEAFDFSVKVNTLVYYAGFNNPDDVPKAYSVIYGTDLYEVVRDVIDEGQYFALVSAAKELVSNNKEILNNSYAAKMNDLIYKMDEIMNEGNSVVNDITNGALQEKINEMLQAVNLLGNPSGKTEETDNVVAFPTGDKA